MSHIIKVMASSTQAIGLGLGLRNAHAQVHVHVWTLPLNIAMIIPFQNLGRFKSTGALMARILGEILVKIDLFEWDRFFYIHLL
jgi:hypothetical protein